MTALLAVVILDSPDSPSPLPSLKRKSSTESPSSESPTAKRQKNDRKFSPIPAPMRKVFATALGLTSCKPVFFGRTAPLTVPKRKRSTKGDGNCYFRSISYILSGTEDNHQTIRDQVVSHMTNNLTTKLDNYMNQRVSTYLEQTSMDKDGIWATDAEIMATASLLGIDIVVYTQMGPAKEWLTYPASFSLCTQSDNAIYLENLGDHFNPVISVE